MSKYVEIPASAVPSAVRFFVPGRHQGQIIEVAYGNGHQADEADDGDPYKRVTDQSIPVDGPGRVTYYRRSAS